MSFFKDFVGLNYAILDPILDDFGAEGGNTIGYDLAGSLKYSDSFGSSNQNITSITKNSTTLYLPILNLHRNGPYGYPMWKQLRVGQTKLIQKQNKSSIFTYQDSAGEINNLVEPAIAENIPISLIGDVSISSNDLASFENRSVEIKTSFNNETHFFANTQANQHFETIKESDENYEALVGMYLDGGLEDAGSLLDSFTLLTYKQTVWPKQQYAYLDQTRSRKFYVNTFWRNNRSDRTQTNVDSGFGVEIAKQSIWPLDAASDFTTRTRPIANFVTASVGTTTLNYKDVGHRIGGSTATFGSRQNNSADGSGILQNSYSKFFNGLYRYAPGNQEFDARPQTDLLGASVADTLPEILSASCIYSRRHTIKSMQSNYNPSFPSTASSGNPFNSPEGIDHSLTILDGSASLMLTSSLFEGMAAWDAGSQSGVNPFYDSYEDFAQETRLVGKGYSTVPEFLISNHVEHYEKRGVSSALENIFESSGALSQATTTENSDVFYKVLSNSDFLRHFDLIKKDHQDFVEESIIGLRCKAIKKFLPYEGFYPAQRTVQLAKQFALSYSDYVKSFAADTPGQAATPVESSIGLLPVMEPLFSPGILFNTIKSGVAVDFPLYTRADNMSIISAADNNYTERYTTGDTVHTTGSGVLYQNFYIGGSNEDNITSDELEAGYSRRIPFEALVDPKEYISNLEMISQEPHPFGLAVTSSMPGDEGIDVYGLWSGQGDNLYSKMANNLLAEITDFFIEGSNMKTIASLEESDPNFGNAIAGTFYTMRVKMKRSRLGQNRGLAGFRATMVDPPQDLITYQDRGGASLDQEPGDAIRNKNRFNVRESLTMYSRPSAFGPPTYGGNGIGNYRGIEFRECGSFWGTNYPYTPPYYHGESWCDLIFYANETKKYTLDEIISSSAEYPYYTRFWWPGTMDTIRDLTGYEGTQYTGSYTGYENSPWKQLFDTGEITVSTHSGSDSDVNQAGWGTNTQMNVGTSEVSYLVRPSSSAGFNAATDYMPQHPFFINYSAMQLDSSINLFGKGTVRKKFDIDTGESSEVASADTIRGKTRWIIQPKFETPILNFKKYENLTDNGGTMPSYAQESVPRGMWHQYGEIPQDPAVGVFLQANDIPTSWLQGALCVTNKNIKKVKSLADLVGFSKEPVRLGEISSQKDISECVVAVPFIEKDATRKFFSIPREDIDSCIGATKREVEPGVFVAGGPPKAGDTVYQMVKKMQKYVFPPSMDFVKYEEIDPFAMYIFEFKHNLSQQDVSNIWQNIPPEIGTKIEEAEASISHELLAHELLGGGAVVKNNVLDENAEGNGIPSNIQWMVFKVKKRAKTNYFDKVIKKKGTTEDTSTIKLEGISKSVVGKKDKEITYNWPYDFFSLVELVKIDAEVTFSNIENDDKGQKSIKKVESKKTRDPSMINKARGKGRIE